MNTEVKVGQVWKSKYGSYYKILDVKDKTVVVEIDGDDVTVIFKKYLTDAKLVSESDPSDLEIVQKALDISGRELELGTRRRWWLYEKQFSTDTVSSGNDTESLLTWAKQTIGVE